MEVIAFDASVKHQAYLQLSLQNCQNSSDNLQCGLLKKKGAKHNKETSGKYIKASDYRTKFESNQPSFFCLGGGLLA